MTDRTHEDDQPTDPPVLSAVEGPVLSEVEGRTFSLNSREFYQAVCAPRERPWIPNGALPPTPRARDPEVIIERSEGAARKRRKG